MQVALPGENIFFSGSPFDVGGGITYESYAVFNGCNKGIELNLVTSNLTYVVNTGSYNIEDAIRDFYNEKTGADCNQDNKCRRYKQVRYSQWIVMVLWGWTNEEVF